MKEKEEKKEEEEGREERGLAGSSQGGEEKEGGIQELPEQERARLMAALEAKTKEAAENYDRFLRACAELENYKKRADKEKAECVASANEALLVEVLPLIDNFERALAHAGSEETLVSLREGVKLTIDQVMSVLKKYGLNEINALGEKFDPVLHHAISHEETTEAGEGTVVREFQKGYMLKGRLLRPAMVAVAKAPGKAGGEETVH